MSTTTPLTDSINALTTYANETTGASDTDLSSAVATLVAGYGGGGGGVSVNGIELTAIYMSTDEEQITVSHSFGSVPKIAILVASLDNQDWADVDGQTILLETLGSSPADGSFAYGTAGSVNINGVTIYSGSESYQGTTTYTTYPATMTSTDVTFATGRYYSGKFKAGLTYLAIIVG